MLRKNSSNKYHGVPGDGGCTDWEGEVGVGSDGAVGDVGINLNGPHLGKTRGIAGKALIFDK